MVIITSHEFGRSLIIKSSLSHPLIIATAAAFSGGCSSPYADTLRSIFGNHAHPSFCYDIQDTHAFITFGSVKAARTLMRDGVPMQVDPEHAVPFRLFLSESMAVRTGRLPPSKQFESYCLRTYDALDSSEEEVTQDD
jgi:hypothetical protein